MIVEAEAEADEGSIRQSVAHVSGKAVHEVILGAVRLVGNDDDVAPFGKRWIDQSPSALGKISAAFALRLSLSKYA